MRTWGEKPNFNFTPKEHYDIGSELGLIDTETAGEVSGSRYAYLKGDLVLMQFALINMCYEILTNVETFTNNFKSKNLSLNPKALFQLFLRFYSS